MVKDVKGGVAALAGGTAFFCAYLTMKCDDHFYKNYVLPVLFRMDAEFVHHLSLKVLKYRLLRPGFEMQKFLRQESPSISPALHCKIWDYELPSPIGLAAGYDKNGEAIDGLLQLGFSFMEVGSVTRLPQPGNEKPRVFRLLEDAGLINRYGCPSDGYLPVFERLFKRKQKLRERAVHELPSQNDVLNSNFAMVNDPLFSVKAERFNGLVGANLTMNRNTENVMSDLCEGLSMFVRVADFVVLNLSTPNTPGVRRLQERSTLSELLTHIAMVREALGDPNQRRKPLLLKIAPDLTDSEMSDIAKLALDSRFGVDGLVVTNTTVQRPAEQSQAEWSIGKLNSPHAKEIGGLSGAPLRDRATACVSRMYTLTDGRVPIVGVGGVSNGRDAFEKIAHGASLVEIYTAIVYEGPGIAKRINAELEQELASHGFKSVSEAVGCYHRKEIAAKQQSSSRPWYQWPVSWFSWSRS